MERLRKRQPRRTGQPNQCQFEGCPRDAQAPKPYCFAHMHAAPSPLTGAEPDWDPRIWNVKRDIRETHNCFAYALNVHDPRQIARCRGKKECNAPTPQPGLVSGQDNFSNDKPKTCPNMLARVKGDNPDILYQLGGQLIRFEDRCPIGSSKIALIIDESDDYHFVRADSNGYWSHKPGGTAVTNVDAFGHLIRNPQRACYNYKRAGKGDLNYNIFCSYMCVPRNQPLYMRAGGMIKEFFA